LQIAAEAEEHGFSSQWSMTRPAPVVFGGSEAWATPVSAVLSFQLPPDAPSGTYEFVLKARRVYRGEEALATTSLRLHVGSPLAGIGDRVEPLVGNCERCHTGLFDLSGMLHYNGDAGSCTSCHFPLKFVTNNLLPYRIQRIHYLSERYTEDRRRCAPYHVNPTREVLDDARWLVCTSCHDPWETHDHHN
jgi:hypothetical protein